MALTMRSNQVSISTKRFAVIAGDVAPVSVKRIGVDQVCQYHLHIIGHVGASL